MKRSFVTLFLAMGLSFVAFSQSFYTLEAVSKTELFTFGNWTREYKNAIIFADVCNVRTAPDSKAEVAGKLTIGTSVQILEVSAATHTQGGVKAPWVKVKASVLTGYVWGGLLTNGSAPLADGKLLLWGLVSLTEKEEGWFERTASVRVAHNGTQLAKHDFPLTYASRPDEGELFVFNPPKLTGVQNMMILGTPSEACGVTATQHYFLYTDEGKLVFVGSGHSMGDGGVLHSSLEYVFPYPLPEDQFADYHYNPDAEHVLRVENEGSFDEDCDWVETHKVRNFKWEAGKLSKYCEY